MNHTILKDYDKETLIEIQTKLLALEYSIEHNDLTLDQAEVALDLYNNYTRRILDLTILIQNKAGRL